MTEKYLSSLKSNFPFDVYRGNRKDPSKTGAFAARVNLNPEQTFELLEVLFGPYKDASKNYIFVDNKTTWERFIETPEGGLRVYDFKGLTSIGYSGRELSDALRERANELKGLLESLWVEYAVLKKQKIRDDIQKDPFNNFIYTFGAVRVLTDKAKESGSLLECLVLFAAMIDAQLRIAIVLQSQLKNKNDHIEQDLIFQKGRSYISERQIHKLAQSEKLITEKEFEELSSLYDLRNKAVHRYFISDFEYADLSPVLHRYEAIHETLSKKVMNLEKKQVNSGIGMTTSIEDPNLDEETARLVSKNVLKRLNSEKPFVDVPERKLLFPKEEY